MPGFKFFTGSLLANLVPRGSVDAYLTPNFFSGTRKFIHDYKQKSDFKDALLFAEQEIIPCIKDPKLRKTINAGTIENWIIGLHKLAAKSLYAQDKARPGQYIDNPLFTWEKTNDFYFDLLKLFIHKPKNLQLLKPEILKVFKKYGLQNVAETWFSLINEAHKEKKHFFYLPSFATKGSYSEQIFFGIAHAKFKKKLTQEQERAVDTVCLIRYPSIVKQKNIEIFNNIASRLHAFAEDKNSNPSEEELVDLFSYCFAALYNNHAFAGANSRVINIFCCALLIGFGKQEIVLRPINTIHDPDYDYDLAVRDIATTVEPLKQLIRKRLHDESNIDCFESKLSNDNSKTLSEALIEICHKLEYTLHVNDEVVQQLQSVDTSQDPNSKINAVFRDEIDHIAPQFGCHKLILQEYLPGTDLENALAITTCPKNN